jgi:ATP-binding cassette, subfamily A (ABC1), member 3
LIPYFSLAELLKNYGLEAVELASLEDNRTGILIAMNLLSAFIFMSVILMIEYRMFERMAQRLSVMKRRIPISSNSMDDDVVAEITKVNEMTTEQMQSSNLVLKALTKYYGNFLAVNKLHLDVESCECFGLLGINGAGKTSTFKMLTGDETISQGDAFIQGLSITKNLGSVHKMIGYCSQADSILPELTGYETLKIFSLLRGIPKTDINESINHLSHELGFRQHLHKKVRAFSGGNKRKLSLALAILGKPQLIFLDEPTTGIDPQAKRLIWNAIKKIISCGHAVILTSHSMDECEALCSKIGIMVNGEFRCLGSVQHLKNKYSKGYILTVKLDRDDENLTFEVQNRINFHFPSAQMKEKYIDILTFHIENADLKLSSCFTFMEQLKNEMDISHYTLTQMSLEQVFLHFSKNRANEPLKV